MDDRPLFGYLYRDYRLGVKALKEAYPFIRRHRLWVGVLSYGWMSKFLLVLAVIVGLNFFVVLVNWFGSVHTESPLAYGASLLDLYAGIFKKGYHLLTLGGMKYLILILTEVLIFHVARRSEEVLKGSTSDGSLKTFMRALVRMIKISLFAWGMEIATTALASVILGYMDANWLKSPLSWVLQCFFLGAVVLDGYFEYHRLSIKESLNASRQVSGLALTVGAAAYLIMAVPVVGAVLAPFFASITASLALFEMDAKGWLPLKQKI